MAWSRGDVIVRRDVWRGHPWVASAAIVVRDDPELLALYVAEGAEIGVATGAEFPIVHPWFGRGNWEGHGVVALHRPGDAYSIWVFWEGEEKRHFAGWYVNLEAPFVRTELGIDTRDYELDLWSEDGRSWQFKDAELMEQRVREGMFTAEEARMIEAEGARVHAEFSSGGAWWDDVWAEWTPPPEWDAPRLPADWTR